MFHSGLHRINTYSRTSEKKPLALANQWSKILAPNTRSVCVRMCDIHGFYTHAVPNVRFNTPNHWNNIEIFVIFLFAVRYCCCSCSSYIYIVYRMVCSFIYECLCLLHFVFCRMALACTHNNIYPYIWNCLWLYECNSDMVVSRFALTIVSRVNIVSFYVLIFSSFSRLVFFFFL